MANTTYSVQEIFNRCFNIAGNYLQISGSFPYQNPTQFSTQEVLNRIFDSTNNCFYTSTNTNPNAPTRHQEQHIWNKVFDSVGNFISIVANSNPQATTKNQPQKILNNSYDQVNNLLAASTNLNGFGDTKYSIQEILNMAFDSTNNIIRLFSILSLSPSTYLDSSQPATVLADGAVQFASSSQEYLTITNAAQTGLNLGTADFSFDIHGYRDTAVTSKVIATKYQDSNNYWEFGFDASNKLYFKAVISGSTLISVTGTTAITNTSTWYNFGIVIDRTTAANCKIYVNNVDDTTAGATTSASTINNIGAFIVGANGALTTFLNGRKDSFGIWLRKLTSTEITFLYNGGAGRMATGLVGQTMSDYLSWYGYNEESGTRYDSNRTSKNDLTATGAEMTTNGTFTGSSTGWTEGSGWAYGTNNEVSVAATADLSQSTTAAVVGHTYKITYTISVATSGSLAFTFGGVTGTTRSTNATFTEYMTATSTAALAIHPVAAFTGTIDDVSVTSLGPIFNAGIASGIATDGNFGLQLNGTTQSLSITDASQTGLNPLLSDFSFEIWANPDQLPATITLLQKGAAGNGAGNPGFRLALTSTGLISIDFHDSGVGNRINISAGAVTVKNWTQIICTLQRTGNMTLYTNNVSLGTADISGQQLTVNSSSPLSIGVNNNLSSQFFPGRVDNTRIWVGKVLSVGEINTLFNGGKGLKSYALTGSLLTGLISGYDYDPKSGIIADSVGSNTLTNNGTAVFGQGVDYYEGSVSKETDLTTNSNNFSQITPAQRPTVITNIQNGLQLVRLDGVSQNLQNAADLVGTGDVTIFAIIKTGTTYGGSNNGRIISNGKLIFGVSSTNNTLNLMSDGSTTAVGATNAVLVSTSYIVAITRTSAGVANIYINGSLSGSANQSSGTPAAGTPTVLGNNAALARGFDGYMSAPIIFPSILSAGNLANTFNYLNSVWKVY